MSSVSASSVLPRPDLSAIRKQVDKAIDRDVAAGKISADDANAIKSAEDDISKLLDAQGGGAGSGTSADPSLDPSQLKSKIDSLIDGEVKSGKLTSAQADELKSVLQKGHRHGGHAPSGASGAQQPSNPLDALFDANAASGASSTVDSTSLLQDFLKQLQNGSATDNSATPRLVDYLA